MNLCLFGPQGDGEEAKALGVLETRRLDTTHSLTSTKPSSLKCMTSLTSSSTPQYVLLRPSPICSLLFPSWSSPLQYTLCRRCVLTIYHQRDGFTACLFATLLLGTLLPSKCRFQQIRSSCFAIQRQRDYWHQVKVHVCSNRRPIKLLLDTCTLSFLLLLGTNAAPSTTCCNTRVPWPMSSLLLPWQASLRRLSPSSWSANTSPPMILKLDQHQPHLIGGSFREYLNLGIFLCQPDFSVIIQIDASSSQHAEYSSCLFWRFLASQKKASAHMGLCAGETLALQASKQEHSLRRDSAHQLCRHSPSDLKFTPRSSRVELHIRQPAARSHSGRQRATAKPRGVSGAFYMPHTCTARFAFQGKKFGVIFWAWAPIQNLANLAVAAPSLELLWLELAAGFAV